MAIKCGTLVTRSSHGHDVLFRVVAVQANPGRAVALLVSSLQGWSADAPLDDLHEVEWNHIIDIIRRETQAQGQVAR